MQLPPVPFWLLVVSSSFLQLLCFPIAGPVPTWRTACCWIALLPLLHALVVEDKHAKSLSLIQGAALGYACGFLWYAGNCAWIYQTMYLYGGLPKPVAFAIVCLFSLYLGLYHALFSALVVLVRRSTLGSRVALSLAPFVWVAVELARARITGFPWDLLGYSQVDNLLLTRLAPFAGVMGIGFLIIAVNAGLAFALQTPKRPLLAASVLLLAAAMQCGAYIVTRQHAQYLATQSAILLQENLEVGAVGREVRPLTRNDEYQLFSAWTTHPLIHQGDGRWAPAKPNLPSDLIVWPEAPSHLESNDPAFRATIGTLAHTSSAPVIAGSLGVDLSPQPERGYFLYDSAALFDRTGQYQGRYDKIHLVPWGEYVPFKQLFSFAHKLTEGVGDMDRGHERSVFRTGGHAYGVFVCYESIFGDEVRQFVKNGAEVLVNISDDGWYGDSGAPWQHLNMARMRAIENQRWVLRSTNTGITTAIDPEGRIAFAAPRHVRAAFGFPFGFNRSETFYTRHGDWFAYLCALVTVGAVMVSRQRKLD